MQDDWPRTFDEIYKRGREFIETELKEAPEIHGQDGCYQLFFETLKSRIVPEGADIQWALLILFSKKELMTKEFDIYEATFQDVAFEIIEKEVTRSLDEEFKKQIKLAKKAYKATGRDEEDDGDDYDGYDLPSP